MSSDFNEPSSPIDNNFNNTGSASLPNATATLVLGILSIVTCFCYGIIGLILGIIALVISSNSWKEYKINPNAYKDGGNLKAGRICAIIGVCLSAAYLIFIVMYIIFVGTFALSSFRNF